MSNVLELKGAKERREQRECVVAHLEEAAHEAVASDMGLSQLQQLLEQAWEDVLAGRCRW